jgi:hypothetical protein
MPAPECSRTSSILREDDWENDLIVVVRWIQQRALDDFLGQVLAAITPRPAV